MLRNLINLLLLTSGWILVVPPLESAELKVVKVKDDLGTAVQSKIFVVESGDEKEKGETDPEGVMNLSDGCGSGVPVVAKPKDPNYYAGRSTCTDKPEVQVRVTRASFLANLKDNALYFERSGDFARAALLFSDVAARQAEAGFDNSEARAKVFSNMMLHFKLKPEVPTFDGQHVMGDRLQGKILVFQKKERLPVTGRLDYDTLSAAAKADVSDFLFERVDG